MNTESKTQEKAPAPKAKRQGRTKGSFSFTKMPLKSLLERFPNGDTNVVVSRRWAESVGFKDVATGPVAQINLLGRAEPAPEVKTEIF